MTEHFPEKNKRAGVFYATSSEGLELPVIDVNHPEPTPAANNRAAIRPRGLAVYRELVKRVGWDVARVIERPFSEQVLLT